MGAFALASKSVRLLTILCLAVCLRPGSAAADPTLTTLYNFAGNDGAQPTGRLIFDKSGALYGTTDIGGAEGSPSYGDLVFDKSGALRSHPFRRHFLSWHGIQIDAARLGGWRLDRDHTPQLYRQ